MKIAVLTSGGDAPGMNAAIRAVARTAIYYGYEVYGILNGYLGLYQKDIIELNRKTVADTLNRGGTFLGSARFEALKQKEVVEECAANLRSLEIDCLVVIGGDGSYIGASKLMEQGIKVICIPGTIDNDVMGTEFTIGFDTAVNTVVEALDKIRDTLNSHHRCSIIEVMGRSCANIAYRAGIAVGAETIITNKEDASEENIISIIKEAKENSKKHALIVINEDLADVFQLAKYIEEKSGYETRASILGHIQRGGTPSAFDRYIASKIGAYSMEIFHKGIYNVALGTDGHDVFETKLEEIVNKSKNCYLENQEIIKMLK